MPILEELSDSLQVIDFVIYLIIEGGWFEEVYVEMGVSFSFFIWFECAFPKKFTIFRFVYIVILNPSNFCALDILFL